MLEQNPNEVTERYFLFFAYVSNDGRSKSCFLKNPDLLRKIRLKSENTLLSFCADFNADSKTVFVILLEIIVFDLYSL